ncbi:MAG: hypothetical protein DHS20C14_22740 [Phycisphaeraceae bacterium]|nr:MAG: hypothetical protein DHS20C14_22740 [Phycisphaeraceae bacterium]
MNTMLMLADSTAAMDFGQGNENLIPIIAVAGGLLVAIVAIVSSMITSAKRTRQREETRREIAAYVAEGSMTPEDAEKLLLAEPKKC